MAHNSEGQRLLPPVTTGRSDGNVFSAVDSYEKYHSCHGGNKEARRVEYADMVNKYYDLATSFYEYGWGQSFHFAHRWRGESHKESLKRHEHYLALKLKLTPESKVLDVGCGVGGPLREISLFSGAHITGLNNNAYQVQRAEMYNAQKGHWLPDKCGFVKGDFMKMPFEDATFDAVYEIDATCHAPDAAACYKEVLRVLRPGGFFAGYEWCSTSAYDPSKHDHKLAMDEIELGNGLPDVRSTAEVIQALNAAGFEVVESQDLADIADIPWWQPLDPQGISLESLRTSTLGRLLTRALLFFMENTGIAPKGTQRVHRFLEAAADGLVAGGKKGIFTPVFFFLAKKPETR